MRATTVATLLLIVGFSTAGLSAKTSITFFAAENSGSATIDTFARRGAGSNSPRDTLGGCGGSTCTQSSAAELNAWPTAQVSQQSSLLATLNVTGGALEGTSDQYYFTFRIGPKGSSSLLEASNALGSQKFADAFGEFISEVPEPCTLALFGAGLLVLSLFGVGRRRRRPA